MTDKQIQENVLRELGAEPHVKCENIAVTVADGAVVLFGFVDSDDQKQAVEQAAKRIYGVRGVANDLVVKPDTTGERPDPEIARDAIWALSAHNAVVPTKQIQVTVRGGWITLEGEVHWNYQKEATELAVAHLAGVRGVSNGIAVNPHLLEVCHVDQVSPEPPMAGRFVKTHGTTAGGAPRAMPTDVLVGTGARGGDGHRRDGSAECPR